MPRSRHRFSDARSPVARQRSQTRRRRDDSRFRMVAICIASVAAAIIIFHTVDPGAPLFRWQSAGPPAINDVDPLSGKSVDRFSPRITYENYTIAFCCKVSKNRWMQLPKADKDAFVQCCVNPSETGK